MAQTAIFLSRRLQRAIAALMLLSLVQFAALRDQGDTGQTVTVHVERAMASLP